MPSKDDTDSVGTNMGTSDAAARADAALCNGGDVKPVRRSDVFSWRAEAALPVPAPAEAASSQLLRSLRADGDCHDSHWESSGKSFTRLSGDPAVEDAAVKRLGDDAAVPMDIGLRLDGEPIPASNRPEGSRRC